MACPPPGIVGPASCSSRAPLCVGFAGNRHCPPSGAEALSPPGSSGFWVGHSGGRFAAGLLPDRGPGASPAPGDFSPLRHPFTPPSLASRREVADLRRQEGILVALERHLPD